MEKACKALHSLSQRSVEFAVYQLQDVSKAWYDSWEEGRQATTPPIELGEFKEKFMERFLLKRIHQARVREFETLKQGLNMIVAEYDD